MYKGSVVVHYPTSIAPSVPCIKALLLHFLTSIEPPMYEGSDVTLSYLNSTSPV